jgi:hypothetical protein
MRIHLQWVTADPKVCAFFANVPQVNEQGRRNARTHLRRGIATGIFNVVDIDAACDLVFGTLSETVRRVARHPGKAKHCNAVVTTVLVGLGVGPEKIRQVMALPLPKLRLPPRSEIAALREH